MLALEQTHLICVSNTWLSKEHTGVLTIEWMSSNRTLSEIRIEFCLEGSMLDIIHQGCTRAIVFLATITSMQKGTSSFRIGKRVFQDHNGKIRGEHLLIFLSYEKKNHYHS